MAAGFIIPEDVPIPGIATPGIVPAKPFPSPGNASSNNHFLHIPSSGSADPGKGVPLGVGVP